MHALLRYLQVLLKYIHPENIFTRGRVEGLYHKEGTYVGLHSTQKLYGS